MVKQALARLVDGKNLDRREVAELFEELFEGHATPAQVGALIVALRMKGETPEEICGAAEVMRAKATWVRTPEGTVVLDTCGTGGDGQGTFNISTAVAIIAAACGATVAKHGNRSVSSRSGSADVLAAAGVNVQASVATVERCIAECGIGFLFAPNLHGAMKHVAAPRTELGVRSIFNLLGPLSNPARATRQLLGVYSQKLVPVVAHTLLLLGCDRALVVHGEPGLDELSPCGSTTAALVKDGKLELLTLTPEDAGLSRTPLEALAGGGPEENAVMLKELLAGAKTAAREAVLLNAAAALWVAGSSASLKEGALLARAALDDGRALRTFDRLVVLSREQPA